MVKSFTLVEIIVVIALVVLFTSLILPFYRKGEERFVLERSAYKLAQDIRDAQEMAMSVREIEGQNVYGFGVHFKESWRNFYVLFADLNGNHHRDGNDQDIKTYYLERGVEISNLAPSSDFSVLFAPPDPEVWINNSLTQNATVTISVVSSPSLKKNILVNCSGLIEVTD